MGNKKGRGTAFYVILLCCILCGCCTLFMNRRIQSRQEKQYDISLVQGEQAESLQEEHTESLQEEQAGFVQEEHTESLQEEQAGFVQEEQADLSQEGQADLSQPFSVRMTNSKEWIDRTFHEQMPLGLQYDGEIINNSDTDLKDWKLVLQLSQDIIIDSSWNGNFSINGNELTITPLSCNQVIPASGKINFGLVLYSEDKAVLQSGRLSGFSVSRITGSPAFYILVIMLALWLVIGMNILLESRRKKEYKRLRQHDERMIAQSMSTFAQMIDARDTYTRGHSTRVALYASEIARRMNFKPEDVKELYYTALLHDCGKIGIPDAVLKKPTKLTKEEWKLIQAHTVLGSHVLKDFTAVRGISDGALYHHERYDGKGYPKGLAGNAIPLFARIICVADSYDAMSSNRCYRDCMNEQSILEELRKNSGTQFDPAIVKYMIEMIQDGYTCVVQKNQSSTKLNFQLERN